MPRLPCYLYNFALLNVPQRHPFTERSHYNSASQQPCEFQFQYNPSRPRVNRLLRNPSVHSSLATPDCIRQTHLRGCINLPSREYRRIIPRPLNAAPLPNPSALAQLRSPALHLQGTAHSSRKSSLSTAAPPSFTRRARAHALGPITIKKTLSQWVIIFSRRPPPAYLTRFYWARLEREQRLFSRDCAGLPRPDLPCATRGSLGTG